MLTDITAAASEFESSAAKLQAESDRLASAFGFIQNFDFTFEEIEELDEPAEEASFEDDAPLVEESPQKEEQEDFLSLIQSGALFSDDGTFASESICVKDTLQYLIDTTGENKEKQTIVELLESLKLVTNIDGIDFTDEEEEQTEIETRFQTRERVKVREYTNQAQYYKHKFDKPVENIKNPKKTIVAVICFCAAAGFLFGERASSYYEYVAQSGEDVEELTALSSLAGGFMNSPSFNPLNCFKHGDIFITNFLVGAVVMGLIAFFIINSAKEKERSRVGHEHGNARFGTTSDFKQFLVKFME